MRRSAVILGTGKMARDVGAFLLGRGLEVTWLTRDHARLEAMGREIDKIARRLSRATDGAGSVPLHRCATAENPGVESTDVILETVNEDAADKRRALGAVEGLLAEDTLLLTNSSSFPPSTLHPRLTGMHFFYPVALTRFVELVFPPDATDGTRRRVVRLAEELGLGFVEEEEGGAFAVNRLLLPLQAEALGAVAEGADPSEVDRLSASDLCPLGQLSMMDEIGLDTVAAALASYRAAMPEEEAAAYGAFASRLDDLTAAGKLGKKVRDGLTRGGPLPWSPRGRNADELEVLGRRFRLVLLNSCLARIDAGDLTEEGLDRALAAVFQAQLPVGDVIAAARAGGAAEELDRLYDAHRIGYFRPSPGWRK